MQSMTKRRCTLFHSIAGTKDYVRRVPNDVCMARRRYPDCVSRLGPPRVRSLDELLVLPRRSPLADELARALAAAARLHMLKSDLRPVPVRVTATSSEAGAYRYRKANPIDLRVSSRSGHAATGFLHELAHLIDHQVHYDKRSRVWASSVHPAFSEWRGGGARGPRGRRPAGGAPPPPPPPPPPGRGGGARPPTPCCAAVPRFS